MVLAAVLPNSIVVIKTAECKQGTILFDSWVLMTML